MSNTITISERLAEALERVHEQAAEVARLKAELVSALGSERILSNMLGESAILLGLDPSTHDPSDIAPHIEVLKEDAQGANSLRERCSKLETALREIDLCAATANDATLDDKEPIRRSLFRRIKGLAYDALTPSAT